MMNLITLIIKLWQKTRFIRTIFSFPECRFYPSCSDYAIQSIKTHGGFKGLFMAFKRVCKCHPLSEGGVDYVTSD